MEKILNKVQCGLFGVTEDHAQSGQSLDQRFVKNERSTYFLEAQGESMTPLILPGDVLVVDRSVTPAHNHIVIAVFEGELICKRLLIKGRSVQLACENPRFRALSFENSDQLIIWGVVRAVVHPLLERGVKV